MIYIYIYILDLPSLLCPETLSHLKGCPRTVLTHFATNHFRASGETILSTLKYVSYRFVKHACLFFGGGVRRLLCPESLLRLKGCLRTCLNKFATDVCSRLPGGDLRYTKLFCIISKL